MLSRIKTIYFFHFAKLVVWNWMLYFLRVRVIVPWNIRFFEWKLQRTLACRSKCYFELLLSEAKVPTFIRLLLGINCLLIEEVNRMAYLEWLGFGEEFRFCAHVCHVIWILWHKETNQLPYYSCFLKPIWQTVFKVSKLKINRAHNVSKRIAEWVPK